MKQWSLTLHGPTGILSQFDSGEAHFVLGTEEAPDVLTIAGDDVAPRHAWVWLADARLQVEDLAGGTLVNGHPITERVEVEYPASVQVGSITLVVEEKVAAVDISSAVTIPQRPAAKGPASSSTEVTIVTRPRPKAVVSSGPTDSNKAATLCEYTLVREIARGGMGQIYFGEDPQLKRQVAVKVSSISEGGEDPRFSKEAEVLAHLAHPNIVPIYNIGVDAQRRPFYSMKLVKGRTLQAVLNALRDGDAAAVKEYPRAALLTVFRKVCDAMAFAHAKGVLHRDLKPENIMVGEYGEVLVMDWGLAKVLGGEETNGGTKAPANDTGDYGMTLEGEVMGTPQYMSPEQAEGMVAELDVRSDIYSLGGILYAILTLRPPVDGKTLDEVLTKVKKGDICSMSITTGGKQPLKVASPGAREEEAPEALRAVTLKAMARDRMERYGSVEEFAADIEAYQNGFATRAEDAGALRKLVLFVKRNKTVSALVLVMLLGALAFTVRLAASEREARASAERAMKSESLAVLHARKADESSEEARRSEKKAVEEKNAARRASAQAQITLAEAAEEASDARRMRLALSEVPQDLRDATWRYLDARVDASDLTIAPPGGVSWVGLEDNPADPETFLALQKNGQVSSINFRTGEVKPLWKAGGSDVYATLFAVSRDGTLAIVGLEKKSSDLPLFEAEIRRVSDGVMEGKIGDGSSPKAGVGGKKGLKTTAVLKLWVSPQCTLVYSNHTVEGAKIGAFDTKTGVLLWERRREAQTPVEAGMSAGFSVDQKFVFLFTAEGTVEKLEPLSGKTLEAGSGQLPPVMANYPEAFAATENWKSVFVAGLRSPQRLRHYDPWKGVLKWENKVESYGGLVGGIQYSPKQKHVTFLHPTSSQSSILESCAASGGAQASVTPLLGRLSAGGLLRTKDDAVAALFFDKIRIWNLLESEARLGAFYQGIYSFALSGYASRFWAATSNAPDKNELVLLDATETDSEKQIVLKKDVEGFGSLRPLIVSASRDGTRVLLGKDGMFAGYRFDSTGLHEMWGPRQICKSNRAFLMHPTEDLLWAGDHVVEFSTGRVLSTVDYSGTVNQNNVPYQGIKMCWLDGRRLAAILSLKKESADVSDGSLDRLSVMLFDAASGKSLAVADTPFAYCVCASPDGKSFAEGGVDKRVRIRNSASLAVESEFRGHDDKIVCVAWHPFLPFLATSSSDHTIRIWNLEEGRMLEKFRLPSQSSFIEVSSDGRYLVSRTGNYIKIFEPMVFQRQRK